MESRVYPFLLKHVELAAHTMFFRFLAKSKYKHDHITRVTNSWQQVTEGV